MNPTTKRVWAHIYEQEPANLTEISQALSLPYETVREAVRQLVVDGLIDMYDGLDDGTLVVPHPRRDPKPGPENTP